MTAITKDDSALRLDLDLYVQHTLAHGFSFSGVSLHSAEHSHVTLRPAPANSGICFHVDGQFFPLRPTLFAEDSDRCTTLVFPGHNLHRTSVRIATVEHLLAALAAMEIDNVFIDVIGSEIPIQDGSSEVFVDAMLRAGRVAQEAPRKFLQVTKPVHVIDERCYMALYPDRDTVVDAEISFEHPHIGIQRYCFHVHAEKFAREIAPARTFGFRRDLMKLHAQGLALGASYLNSVVLDKDGVVNPEGTRYPDEFVRHKVLDAIGDLALLGMPMLGRFVSKRGGHRANNRLLQKLYADSSCWRVVHKCRSGTLLPVEQLEDSIAS